jgi:uncharacterized repeat protein (TIGR03803 family)
MLQAFTSYAAAQAPTGPTLKTLYTFTGGSDGSYPGGNMVMGPDGALYGTTTAGGSSNNGTVFSLTPPASPGGAWTEFVIYTFLGAPNGANPDGLVMGPRGTLYGTTMLGGLTDGHHTYGGTVFALIPPASAGGTWSEGWLYRVPPKDESAGNLVIGGDEAIYGINASGVFSLSPAGEETITTTAAAGMVLGSDGTIYCTSTFGGIYGQGSFFSLTPPASGGAWTETLLYSFVGQEANPEGFLTLGPDGVIYAFSPGDGYTDGAIFSLTPPASAGGAWAEDLLYSLNPSYDYSGFMAIGSAGVLYGTTNVGGTGNCLLAFGANYGCGTVYSLTPTASPGGAWTYTVLYNFTGGSDGRFPDGLIIGPHGELYGTTSDNVQSSGGYGTVFSLTP